MPCICCESRFSVKMFRKVVWYFAVFAALIDLGEENVADSMDIEGDRLIQSGSLAIRHGSRVALRISGCIFFLAVVLTFVPFLLQWFSHAYIVPIAVMDIAIAYSTLRLLTSEHNKGRIHIRRLRTTQPLKTGGFHNLLFVFLQISKTLQDWFCPVSGRSLDKNFHFNNTCLKKHRCISSLQP